MPQLTPAEEAILNTLRSQLSDQGILEDDCSLGLNQDATLIRFLRARRFDLNHSRNMILECVNWRKTVGGAGIDDLYRRLDPFDYPERPEVFKQWPISFHKTDKKGRPVNIQHLGGIDVKALHRSVTPERHWETLVSLADCLPREIFPACCHRASRIIDKEVVIIDLEGFGLAKFWLMKDLVRESFSMSQNFYPETVGQILVINAPSTFAIIWSAIRPWLATETQEKINILSSNYQQTLLDLIDADNLPASLGGKCICGGEGGCTASNAGPWLDGRKERRERWLKGETPFPGFPPLNEDNTEGKLNEMQKCGEALASAVNIA